MFIRFREAYHLSPLHPSPPTIIPPPELDDRKNHAEDEPGDVGDEGDPALSRGPHRRGVREGAGPDLDEEPEPEHEERGYGDDPYDDDNDEERVDARGGEPEKICSEKPSDRPGRPDERYMR